MGSDICKWTRKINLEALQDISLVTSVSIIIANLISERSWKTWKVMEFKYFSFQAWKFKVMEFNCWSWEISCIMCGT